MAVPKFTVAGGTRAGGMGLEGGREDRAGGVERAGLLTASSACYLQQSTPPPPSQSHLPRPPPRQMNPPGELAPRSGGRGIRCASTARVGFYVLHLYSRASKQKGVGQRTLLSEWRVSHVNKFCIFVYVNVCGRIHICVCVFLWVCVCLFIYLCQGVLGNAHINHTWYINSIRVLVCLWQDVRLL